MPEPQIPAPSLIRIEFHQKNRQDACTQCPQLFDLVWPWPSHRPCMHWTHQFRSMIHCRASKCGPKRILKLSRNSPTLAQLSCSRRNNFAQFYHFSKIKEDGKLIDGAHILGAKRTLQELLAYLQTIRNAVFLHKFTTSNLFFMVNLTWLK